MTLPPDPAALKQALARGEKPTILEEVDRLRLENVSLKLIQLRGELTALVQKRTYLSQEWETLRRACLDKYGIDVACTPIAEDGSYSAPARLVPET